MRVRRLVEIIGVILVIIVLKVPSMARTGSIYDSVILEDNIFSKLSSEQVKKVDEPDITAPTIKDLVANELTVSSANITFSCDEDCKYLLVYKSKEGVTDKEFAYTKISGDAKKDENVRVLISELKANTTYYVYIKAVDEVGNTQATPYDISFTTDKVDLKADVTLVNSMPKYDQNVRVKISNDTSISNNFKYVWYRNGQEIKGIGSSIYRVVAEDIGMILKVRVTSDDTKGFIDKITSKVSKKKRKDRPLAPKLESKSFDSIVLKNMDNCEFSLDGENWQNRKFENLEQDKDYRFYARYKEDDVFDASVLSNASKTIRTYNKVDFTFKKVEVTTIGGSDGVIIVNATGGSGDYEYSNDGGKTWQEKGMFEGLKANNYEIKVRDKVDYKNVSNVKKVNITQPSIYKFTFDLGYKGANNIVKDVMQSEKVVSQQVSRAGHKFGGWYEDKGFTKRYNFAMKVTGDKTVYAKWIPEDLTGEISVAGSGVVAFGEVLEVNLDSSNNTGDLNYQWYRTNAKGNNKIVGAINKTYKISGEDVGSKLSVVVTSTEQVGHIKATVKEVVAKANHKRPKIPVLKQSDFTSVDINSYVGYEYSIKVDGGNKFLQTLIADKDSLKFENLTPNVKYQIITAIPQSDTHNRSVASAPLFVETKKVEFKELIIFKKPKKLTYKLGEQLDLDGIEIKAIYNDGSERLLSSQEYDVEPIDGTKLEKADRIQVKITYQGKKAKFFVLVRSLYVEKSDDKLAYPDEQQSNSSAIQVPFSDVKQKQWYYESVNKVSGLGVMNGVGNDMFAPDLNSTRAMMWQIFYNLSGSPKVDMKGHHWYSEARRWAKNENITDGEDPQGFVTREQVMTMLYRKSGNPDIYSDGISKFEDAKDISDWAKDAMQWGYENDIIKGVDKAKLAPKKMATRAEIATIMFNYMENVK